MTLKSSTPTTSGGKKLKTMTNHDLKLIVALNAEVVLLRKGKMPRGDAAEAQRRKRWTNEAWEAFRESVVQDLLKGKP